MKKKICLCISNDLGKKVYKLLKKKNYEIKVFSTNKLSYVKNNNFCNKKSIFLKKLNEEKIYYDFIILVYWPYIIPQKYFKYFKNSINFHPSYLPYGRGWYPHIHSLNKNFPMGVSLHQIDSGIDTGGIWAQKRINLKDFYTSDQIYNKCILEIYNLFVSSIFKILSGKIRPKKQINKTKYFKISDINQYNLLSLNKKVSGEDFIKLILSRQYKNKSFIDVIKNKKKYKLFLKLKKI